MHPLCLDEVKLIWAQRLLPAQHGLIRSVLGHSFETLDRIATILHLRIFGGRPVYPERVSTPLVRS